MEFPSKLVEEAVEAFARLPGIGQKTALRLVIHLLNEEEDFTRQITDAVAKMRKEIKFCRVCGNIADQEVCNICGDEKRQRSVICVVEDFRDVIAIENTQQYRGTYHVLGGLITPMEGIGPEDLNIASLIERIREGGVEEVIMALSPTIEGDTTIFYISKQLRQEDIQITTIARGISFGGELEYADEMTLARSIQNRMPYDRYMAHEQDENQSSSS
jgi:recombination protein RecR